MRRTLRLTGILLGMAGLAVLALVIVLALRGQQTQPQSIAQRLQSPIETPTPAAPPPIPTVEVTPIPLCTFIASAAPPEANHAIDSYSFSEPQVVLTHTSAIGIAGWLPDSQRVLITRLIPPSMAREYVDTIDVTTGRADSYGERHSFTTKPVWVASKKSVAMADLVDQDIVLRMNQEGGSPAIETVFGLASPWVAATPDGRQLSFVLKTDDLRPQILDTSLSQRETLPFALPWLSHDELLTIGQQEGPIPYQAAWSVSGTRTVYYNDTGLYLVDQTATTICEINLGLQTGTKRWATHVQWSPNGRYLAALTTVGDPVVRFIDLTMVDVRTGKTQRIDLGHQYLAAFAWGPNSRHLVVLAEADRYSRPNQYDLYVVDTETAASEVVLQSDSLMFAGAYGLAWSPTGKTVAVACPNVDLTSGTISEGRLCIVGVEAK